MEQIIASGLARFMEDSPPPREGTAVFDENGNWVGVLMTPSAYQLMHAAAELASNPDEYERMRFESKRYQLGLEDEMSERESISFSAF